MKTLIEGVFPYNDAKLTCFERPLYAYINALGMDPKYLGLATWSFTDNYVINFCGIMQNIPMQWITDGLASIYRVQVQITNPEDAADAISIIGQELDAGNPVMVFVDSFYCPWYPSYYRSHINHYVLVIGISEHDEFICLDRPDEHAPYRVLPFQDYIDGRGIGEVIRFQCKEKDTNVKQRANKFLLQHLERMKNSDQFERIRHFSTYLRLHFSIEDELKGVHDYRVAAIYTWLKGISTSREKFAEALQMCDIGIPKELGDELKNCAIQWMNVLVQLMLAKDRKIEYDYLADLICNIAQQEEACYCRLLNYCMR